VRASMPSRSGDDTSVCAASTGAGLAGALPMRSARAASGHDRAHVGEVYVDDARSVTRSYISCTPWRRTSSATAEASTIAVSFEDRQEAVVSHDDSVPTLGP